MPATHRFGSTLGTFGGLRTQPSFSQDKEKVATAAALPPAPDSGNEAETPKSVAE